MGYLQKFIIAIALMHKIKLKRASKRVDNPSMIFFLIKISICMYGNVIMNRFLVYLLVDYCKSSSDLSNLYLQIIKRESIFFRYAVLSK